MALIARFVDSIAANPSIRLDLNDGDLWRLQATSRFDPPRAKRARVSTLLVDGAQYPATAYDDRVLELKWLLEAETTDIVAGEVQKLARELDRPGNFFEYRPEGASQSVFFRTHRLGLDVVDPPTDGTRLMVEVNVPAEPFAYGLPETLSAVVVTNNPAAGSNGMFFDVTGIKGDVETPLVMRINYADVSGRQSAIATRCRGNPAGAPFALQAEAMTQRTDTATQPNDATMSGAGNNFSRTTFATLATMDWRLSIDPWPATPSVDVRGTYRVFLRYRKTVSLDVINVRLRWGAPIGPTFNDTVTLPSGLALRYADLGEVTFPSGFDPVTDAAGVMRAVRGMYLDVQAERVSGSGNLDMDCLLFVPADDRLCLVDWPSNAGPTYIYLDGERDETYVTDGSGNLQSHFPLSVPIGGMPRLCPGQTNRVYFVLDVDPTTTSESITNTVNVLHSYTPRYLYVRPVGS